MATVFYRPDGTSVNIDEIAHAVALAMVDSGEIPTGTDEFRVAEIAHAVALAMVESGEIPSGGDVSPEAIAAAVQAYIDAHPSVLTNTTFGETFRWTITDGTFTTGTIDATTGADKANNSYARTGFVPVEEGDDIFGGYCAIYWYDANKTYLGNFAFSGTNLGKHTAVPTNAKFARVSGVKPGTGEQYFKCYRWAYGIYSNAIYNYQSAFSPEHMFSKLRDVESYVGFQNYLRVNRFADKTIVTFGDSFSAGGEWQKDLQVCLHCKPVLNYSKSGGRITNTYATETDERWVQRQYDVFRATGVTPDVVFICLGTNDTGNGLAGLGSFDSRTWVSDHTSYDVTKFYPALQSLLCRIMTDFPNAQIYCGMTPMQGLASDLTDAYGDAMKDVCKKYCVRYVDTSLCQVNPYVDALAVYRNSKSDGHPSAAGKHRIGRYMAEVLLSQGGWFPERDFAYGSNQPVPLD